MFLPVNGRLTYFFARFEQILSSQYPEKQITSTTGNFKFEFEMKSLENKTFKMQAPLKGIYLHNPEFADRQTLPQLASKAGFLVRPESNVFIYPTVLSWIVSY